uniref:RNA-directed DNA polymerase, eukaryota, reverse transcriptase zinc-binding domain protein n=1 Tax=Tanacetum cinerariifolium TaxID=118510 RepID=A0A6L2LC36_TANCI|nr:RNA-directed DNA polymerase, eukaryota, reverse transcriptase zinc-binding domain protein [Tanacetum cinerariifolium]
MIMRFNEIHKFSDGTLHQIDEALVYRVKEFKVNRINPGLNTRFWIRKDMDRSNEFMFAIQKRLKTRKIFRNVESFVGGRVAVCSSLRSLKPKHTIESRAKISSKIISLGHYSIMPASLHTVKSKTDIKSPTHYPCGASVNVMPRNTFEYLRLANMRNTNMLVEMADEYKLKIRKKGHMLDKIWEYCKDVHRDSTYWWHDHGFEEYERDKMGIKIKKYDPSDVQVETFKVRNIHSKADKVLFVLQKMWTMLYLSKEKTDQGSKK